MSEPFVGEISVFAGNFAPRGWAFCDGQLLAIAQNTALFSLLGTVYGGDGRTTFGLPDLRGRLPMHWGSGPGLTSRQIGERSGMEQVTLSSAQMPSHSHSIPAHSGFGNEKTPGGHVPAMADDGEKNYSTLVDVDMAPTGSAGAAQPHTNMQPYQCVNFIIALQGIYPSRS
ncbi:tail fiber protein [Pontiellaceae bacterium B1224]|nr:tail fiber protein [Pontiellaceae bacterium B1224]